MTSYTVSSADRPPYNMTNDGWYALNRAWYHLDPDLHTLTANQFNFIKQRHERGTLTHEDRDVMRCEAAARLESGTEDHNASKAAKAAGLALMCHAIGGDNCINIEQAVAAFEFLDLHA